MSAELINQILRVQNDHAGALGALRQGAEDTSARVDRLELLIGDMRRDITRELSELRSTVLQALGEAERRNSEMLSRAIAAKPPTPPVPFGQRAREVAINPWTAYSIAAVLLVALLTLIGQSEAAGVVAKAVAP